MNTKKVVVLTVLAAVGLLLITFEYSQAAKEKAKSLPPASLKIGVVSIKEVFENCAEKADVEKALAAEGEKRFTELKNLQETIDADKAALSKRKENSQDYMDMLQALMLKQSQLDTQKEFYQRQLSIKEMQEKEKIYRKILAVIASVAKEKEIDLIFSRDDNYLNAPDTSTGAPTPEDFIITTKTHKLLYYNPALDITSSVVAALNSKTN